MKQRVLSVMRRNSDAELSFGEIRRALGIGESKQRRQLLHLALNSLIEEEKIILTNDKFTLIENNGYNDFFEIDEETFYLKLDSMKLEVLKVMNNKNHRGFYFRDLCEEFSINLRSKERKGFLDFALKSLENEGKIIQVNNRYYIAEGHLFKGIFEVGGENFGFVRVRELDNDIFILGRKALNAFEGDEVLVYVTEKAKKGRKASGRIIKILNKKERKVVGVFKRRKNYASLICSNFRFNKHNINIVKNDIKKANDGDVVKVELIEYSLIRDRDWIGKVVEVIGSKNEKNIEILSLISEYELPNKFSALALKEAKELLQIDISNEKKKRVDLTKENIFTIDGISAKDLDDAISVNRVDDGYNLKVCIADVSFYVKEDSNIDKEAMERGTSVYFPTGVIPMLPVELCENLCSLNEGEEKLAFTCDMVIDKRGNVVRYKFYKSIIKSKARFVYDYVNDLFDEKENLDEKYYKYKEDLLLMKELASLLERKGRERGSINFDKEEAEIIMNEDYSKVIDVRLRNRGIAERIIEEFMLIANTCACEYFVNTGVNGVFRAHDEPDMQKLNDFAILANELGYKLKLPKNYYSTEICAFLDRIKGKDEEQLLKRILLRCMKKAEYTAENKGHFALAKRYYTHFTSPIRRYPDLIIHRVLSNIIDGNINFDNLESEKVDLDKKCDYLTQMEKRAEEVERVADKIMMVKFMSGKIGEEYTGIVSGANKLGIFVELANGIEGFVPTDSIEEECNLYDATGFFSLVIGEDYKTVYQMGDKIRIMVKDISYLKRRIEFSIIN